MRLAEGAFYAARRRADSPRTPCPLRTRPFLRATRLVEAENSESLARSVVHLGGVGTAFAALPVESAVHTEEKVKHP